MFADSAKIFIKSGKGGDGHVSFRRELYVPNGGPDGGDGGRGGDVIFQVDKGKNTLVDFRHVRKYIAKDGQEGGKKRCHGADADDLIVKVPEGTVLKDFETGKVIADMSGTRSPGSPVPSCGCSWSLRSLRTWAWWAFLMWENPRCCLLSATQSRR